MRAIWRVFLRMEPVELENNTQVIFIPKITNSERNVTALDRLPTDAPVNLYRPSSTKADQTLLKTKACTYQQNLFSQASNGDSDVNGRLG